MRPALVLDRVQRAERLCYSPPVTLYRPEFEQALRVFASISDAIESEGFARPVLVGGAAVELYSLSAIATGDFDVVIARDDIFEHALRRHGFVRPSGKGVLQRGWVHPGLGLGFEIVGSSVLDGLAEPHRLRLIEVEGSGRFVAIAVEDLIADRMGQYASGSAAEMLEQARTLFNLYQDADLTYMERRIREETSGEYGIADLQPGS